MGIDYSQLAIPKPTPRWKEKAQKLAAEAKAQKECLHCGNSFRRTTIQRTTHGKYCSLRCHNEHRKATNPARQRPCPICGKPMGLVAGRRYKQKTCSMACLRVLRSRSPLLIAAVCTQCGTSFRRHRVFLKRSKQPFCSSECCKKFMVGENSPNFRGDKDPNRGANWNRLAASIRKRDGYSCKRCGLCETANGQKLSVDHIRPWRSFDDKALANDPDNLASLCRKCHAYKTTTVERAWLRGDVLAWKKWVASLSLLSAARFGMRA